MTSNIHSKRAGETRTITIDLSTKLDFNLGEFLTGTPTVVEVGTSALTISNVQVTDVERNIAGFAVAAGRAVQFTVSGGVARNDYTVRITVVTDGTPAQTLVEDFRLSVK